MFIVNALIVSVLSNKINFYTNLVGSFSYTYSFWVVPVAQRKHRAVLAWVVVSGSLCAICARVTVCSHAVRLCCERPAGSALFHGLRLVHAAVKGAPCVAVLLLQAPPSSVQCAAAKGLSP